MECGSDEIACQVVGWLSSNTHLIKQLFAFFDSLWKDAGGQITAFLREHGEKFVALLSFSFGVWRWWIYRERILHKRLEEYIQQSDRRLRPASLAAVEAILRPGRTATLPQPPFAIELREVLERTNWRSFFGLSTIEKQAERQLARALIGLRKRRRIARIASQSLQDQQAYVHTLAGAIAASRARCKPNRGTASLSDYKALREFREVLQFPAHHRDTKAKECEAFQLLRLGQRAAAVQAYLDLEAFAADIFDRRTRELTIARAKRFRAQILQLNAGDAGAGAAWTLIAQANSVNCSLNLRAPHGPFLKWEAIEQAEIHYVSAFIAHRLGFVILEPEHLQSAEGQYQGVLQALPRRTFLLTSSTRRLRKEAAAGLARVERASKTLGDYDLEWLMV